MTRLWIGGVPAGFTPEEAEELAALDERRNALLLKAQSKAAADREAARLAAEASPEGIERRAREAARGERRARWNAIAEDWVKIVNFDGDDICLDGDFSLDELRQIVAWWDEASK